MLIFDIVDASHSVYFPIPILFTIVVAITIIFTNIFNIAIAIILFIVYFDQFINKLLTATNSY